MVSEKQLECQFPHVKLNTTEQCKCRQMPPRDTKAHLYQFATVNGNGSCCGFSPSLEEGQGLLDMFLLSQWEGHSWKGQLAYDVTMCETKVVGGRKQLIAQFNKKWNSNFLTEFESNTFQPLGPFKPSYTKTLEENILFCVTTGEKECYELLPSAVLPKDGTLIMINVNPVEYGHIFMVPYDIRRRPQFLDKRMLQLVAHFAAEVNSCSFHISYGHNISTHSDHIYFQAAYFANHFPVESFPTVNFFDNEGISICKIPDYPLNALLLMSENLGRLVGVVAEVCSYLQKNENNVFNLLVSGCGTKMFLFPQAWIYEHFPMLKRDVENVDFDDMALPGMCRWKKNMADAKRPSTLAVICSALDDMEPEEVHLPASGIHLSAWECGGYFTYNTKSGFDGASEMEISKRMASVSLGRKDFEALKQLCCGIATKLLSL